MVWRSSGSRSTLPRQEHKKTRPTGMVNLAYRDDLLFPGFSLLPDPMHTAQLIHGEQHIFSEPNSNLIRLTIWLRYVQECFPYDHNVAVEIVRNALSAYLTHQAVRIPYIPAGRLYFRVHTVTPLSRRESGSRRSGAAPPPFSFRLLDLRHN